MKTAYQGWLFALLSILALPTDAAPAVVNVPAEVHSSVANFCRSMQLSLQIDETGKEEDKGYMMARFLMDSDKDYKSYSLTDSEGSSVPKEHAQVSIEHARHWAFVIDDSDPKDRAQTVQEELSTVTMLLNNLPKDASVGVYSLARDLRLIARDEHNGWSTAMKDVPTVPVGADPSTAAETKEKLGKSLATGSSAARYNTNLWVGVRTACEELAKQQAGPYAAAPRCLVVLSDGVDESGTSARDLQELCEYARQHGVMIYTIAYPHKDSTRKYSAAERQKGYVGLQALAQETHGFYLSYETERVRGLTCVTGETAAKLGSLVQKMTADLSVISMRVDVRELPMQGSITFALSTEGDDKDSVTIPGEYVGQMLGYFGLHTITEAFNLDAEKKTDELLVYVGSVFRACVYDQQRRKEILEYNVLNKQLAARFRQLCRHLDNHTELLQEDKALINAKLGFYLMNTASPLPQPKKELPPPAKPNKSTMPTQQRSSVLQDWVWIVLAFCVGALILLGCILMVRRSLSDEDEEESAVPSVSLTNVDNPAESWSCEQPQVRIGRRSGNDIVLPYSSVSGTQCFLSYTPAGVWELRDANSTNGTEVNGKRITGVCPLADGDVIGMAEVKLRFNQQ